MPATSGVAARTDERGMPIPMPTDDEPDDEAPIDGARRSRPTPTAQREVAPPSRLRPDDAGRAARRRAPRRPARAAAGAAPHAPLRAPSARPPARAAGDVPAQPRRPAARSSTGSGGGRSSGRGRSSSSATSRARWSATRGCCSGSSRRSPRVDRGEDRVVRVRDAADPRHAAAARPGPRPRARARGRRRSPTGPGGTRIGESFHEFNLRWARRTLRTSGVVIVVSDGWDRGDPALVAIETARLRRNCHRLIWLNPLAGTPGYQPLAGGHARRVPVHRRLPAGRHRRQPRAARRDPRRRPRRRRAARQRGAPPMPRSRPRRTPARTAMPAALGERAVDPRAARPLTN